MNHTINKPPRQPWEYIVAIIATLLILSFASSCTKEYSLPVEKEVLVSITGTKYTTTVNGSTGEYWKIQVSINKTFDREIRIVYQFDDSRVKGMTISHPITSGQSSSAFTQYVATVAITNISILRVDGADDYKFILI